MIKLYPEIIFAAKQKNLQLGAFRLWFIGKHFDQGSGFIPAKDFKYYLKSLGIPKSNTYRYFDQAVALGLLEKKDIVFRLASWEAVASSLGIKNVQRPVLVPMDKFTKKGWFAWVWAGYLLHFKGKPITRGTLEKLSGVPASSQLDYERQTNVKVNANYADICNPEDNPILAMDVYQCPGIYTKGGRIRERLGNTYLPSGVVLGNKGRTKQVNAALSSEVSSQNSCFALYCRDNNELSRKIKANRRWGDARNSPKYVYRHLADLPKRSVWTAVLF